MSKENTVYIQVNEKAEYFHGNTNPSILYPEYLFGSEQVSTKENYVYDLVRNCLYERGYDRENFGKKEWNPLGDIVSLGQNVVIKPNLVNDRNHGKCDRQNNYGLDCLITNVMVTRAICDYCLIALKGTGKVTICDAPIQDCDMEKLLERSEYADLLEFYTKEKQFVYFEDLRCEQRILNRFGVKKKTRILPAKHKYVVMNNAMTAFYDLEGNYEYNVPNYDKEITKSYHNDGKHIFSVSATILDADVIVNLCKPKCHRYAGITAAMKNCVGMVTEKETLPHRRIGENDEGGDSYSGTSKLKKGIDRVLDKQVKAENAGKIITATIFRFFYGILFYLIKLNGEDSSLKGCWHGNDTIWRTILDLNYIIRYANKDGIICNDEQRKILNIGDMIVAGQHNGPLSPEPKHMGIILCSDDEVAFDLTVCKIMGFDPIKMPLYKNIILGYSWKKYKIPNVVLGCTKETLRDIEFSNNWKFQPHDAWKGYIEK